MEVFLYGSILENEQTANDVDLIVVSDKPVDICVYSKVEWKAFKVSGVSKAGKRVVLHPNQAIKSWPKKRQIAMFFNSRTGQEKLEDNE